QILKGINLDIAEGEFVCVVGTSGCGKTTLLRLVAGLLIPSEGKVHYNSKPVLAPQPEIAIVFQDYGKALLPWRTVYGNVELALEAAGHPEGRAACDHRRTSRVDRTRAGWPKVSIGAVGRYAAARADRAVS